MCKICFVAFGKGVEDKERRKTLSRILKNGWDMGNTDGVGYLSWGGVEPAVERALKLTDLKPIKQFGDYALLHVRTATSPKDLKNTHPITNDRAHIVHNGVVNVDASKDTKSRIEGRCVSTCDSERILAAYLEAERDLTRGLASIRGMSNTMIYDETKDTLSVFPHGSDFLIARQRGIFLIYQKWEQVAGIVNAGLGNPYETDLLPQDKVYEFDLSGDSPIGSKLAVAVGSAKPRRVPESSYVVDGTQGWYNYNYPYKNDRALGAMTLSFEDLTKIRVFRQQHKPDFDNTPNEELLAIIEQVEGRFRED